MISAFLLPYALRHDKTCLFRFSIFKQNSFLFAASFFHMLVSSYFLSRSAVLDLKAVLVSAFPSRAPLVCINRHLNKRFLIINIPTVMFATPNIHLKLIR